MTRIFRNTWWAIVPLGIGALFFSTIGFSEYFAQQKIPHTFLEPLYRSLMLFPLNAGVIDKEIPLMLEIGRWLALLTLILAAYSAVLAIAKDKIRLMFLRYSSGHAVVCGLGTKGLQIARDCLDRGKKVVIIEKNPYRDELEILMDRGAVVIHGNATDSYVLRKANVNNASALFAVTNDDHVNVDIAIRVYLAKGKGRLGTKLNAFVHIFDFTLKKLFKQHIVFRDTTDLFNARIFNIYETSARAILNGYPPDRYTPVQGHEDPPVHILIIGFGRRGQSLLLQFCRICQYANGQTPFVTIIDPAAKEKVNRLKGKHEALDDIVRIRSFNGMGEDFLGGDAKYESLLLDVGAGNLSAVYVTAGKVSTGFDLAEQVRRKVSDRTEIVLCLPRDSCLSEPHAGLGPIGYHIFQMNEESCRVDTIQDESIDEMAKFYHQEYATERKAAGETIATNPNLVDWDSLDEEMKESNRLEADHVPVKMRAIGCVVEDSTSPNASFDFTKDRDKVETLARMEHSRWFAERKMAGWTYGPGKKDPEKKTNPLLVPYEELPEGIKEENRKAVRKIPAVLKLAGKKVTLQSPQIEIP